MARYIGFVIFALVAMAACLEAKEELEVEGRQLLGEYYNKYYQSGHKRPAHYYRYKYNDYKDGYKYGQGRKLLSGPHHYYRQYKSGQDYKYYPKQQSGQENEKYSKYESGHDSKYSKYQSGQDYKKYSKYEGGQDSKYSSKQYEGKYYQKNRGGY